MTHRWDGREVQEGGVNVYLELFQFIVYRKLIQQCKAIMLHFKEKEANPEVVLPIQKPGTNTVFSSQKFSLWSKTMNLDLFYLETMPIFCLRMESVLKTKMTQKRTNRSWSSSGVNILLFLISGQRHYLPKVVEGFLNTLNSFFMESLWGNDPKKHIPEITEVLPE